MSRTCRLKSAQRPQPALPSRHERGYGNDWAHARRIAIEKHVAQHGWVCPGFNIPPHPVEIGKLTGDHRVPVALGGTIADGVDVLCGSCNSERGQETRRELSRLRADRHAARRPAESPPAPDDGPRDWFA